MAHGAPDPRQLSRRERQIMDILYREGRASASEVQELLPDPPGYSAVRAMLRVLETNGSAEKAVAALLSGSRSQLTEEEVERLSRLIADARKEGR